MTVIPNEMCERSLDLSEDALQTVRSRRSAGESLKSLAAELGLSWQRLWGLLYSQPPTAPPLVEQHLPRLVAACAGGRLTEKCRPLSLDAMELDRDVLSVRL